MLMHFNQVKDHELLTTIAPCEKTTTAFINCFVKKRLKGNYKKKRGSKKGTKLKKVATDKSKSRDNNGGKMQTN